VVKTGADTEFGKIAKNLAEKETDNEFTKGVSNFSVFILKVIIIFVIFILVVNSLLKGNFLESLLFSIAVAVGLTPEFLPMIMSVTMAKGSINMSKKGVIVKKLSAIPTFGSMDILCTDKTGTLTEDKIQLVKYIDIHGDHSERVLLYAYLNSVNQTGITNPMDTAVMNFKKLDVTEYTKKDEIPFDFNRKRMTVVVESANKETYMITKGAPEEIFQCCKFYEDNGTNKLLDPNNSSQLIDRYLSLSSEGYRVLAVAIKKIPDPRHGYTVKDETDLEMLGYIAFLDPPKKGTREALEKLEEMGVEVKIITGDNDLVAKKICVEVGVKIKSILNSHDLHQMSDAEIKHKVNDITIFARFSPDDKNRIIRLLRENGHVVGYMGDGINDAPSLRSADVGISVSNGVDVAKESADIILTQKSLHQLKDGILEGRRTFTNTMKYIMMGISSNFGNMFSVLGAVIFLPFLPMLPIQILLNNFLYDLSQVTIPTDNVDRNFLAKPKRWSMKFVRNFMLTFGPISSFYDFASFFVLYIMFKNFPGSFQTGWFMESLATQTLVIHIIRTRMTPFVQSRPSKYLFISTIVVVALGWLLPFTPLGSYFGFSRLPFEALMMLVGIVIAYLLTVELGKRMFFRKYFDLQSQ
ncbi:MAG: magnesium-translocating P-type ATPase, partial [Candidatus Moranbacteria bacterium CG_4_9_14_3_um_filter_42_9]